MIDKELEKAKTNHPADTNGDGKVSKAEHDMYLEFKRKELEDKDAMRDAQRRMAMVCLNWYVIISIRSCNRFSKWCRTSSIYNTW